MVQPIDYMGMLPQVDLGQSLLSGIQAGAAIRQVRDQRAEQERAAQMQEQYRVDTDDYFANPSAQKAAALSIKYPGQMKAIKQSWDLQSQGQRDADFGTGMKVYSALNTGRPEIAKQVLVEQITAMKNSGQDTSDLESILGSIDTNPQAASAAIGITLSAMEPEKFGKATSFFQETQKTPIELRKAGAEAAKAETEAAAAGDLAVLSAQEKAENIRNVRSQIDDRTARLNADRAKIGVVELDKDARKDLNAAVERSITSDNASSQMLDLATRLDKEGGGYGAFSNAGEWIKKATGNQDAMSALRKEYSRFRSQEVIKLLPPGSATERETDIIMAGFPDSSADAKSISDFLRAMSKLSQADAISQNAKSEWINEVGHTGRTKRDIVIDGVNVPAGTTFVEFNKDYTPKKIQQRSTEQNQQQIPNRSYMRHANQGAQ